MSEKHGTLWSHISNGISVTATIVVAVTTVTAWSISQQTLQQLQKEEYLEFRAYLGLGQIQYVLKEGDKTKTKIAVDLINYGRTPADYPRVSWFIPKTDQSMAPEQVVEPVMPQERFRAQTEVQTKQLFNNGLEIRIQYKDYRGNMQKRILRCLVNIWLSTTDLSCPSEEPA